MINADSFNVVTTARDFINDGSAIINANDFNVTAGDYFSNQDRARINANNFNVTAAGNFYNQNSILLLLIRSEPN